MIAVPDDDLSEDSEETVDPELLSVKLTGDSITLPSLKVGRHPHAFDLARKPSSKNALLGRMISEFSS